ncbi:MAG TPA: glycoside hydrolase family 88 protein [Bacilli bacterium]
MNDALLEKVIALVRDYRKNNDPKMKWMWGEALLGYAMLLLDEYLETDESLPFLTEYCEYYLKNRPKVDHADRLAPILITYLTDRISHTNRFQELTAEGIDYILNEPRILEDAVNHLGRSFAGKFYPKSIWVDSLVMFALFPALYGRLESDEKMLEIARKQPLIYRKYLFDSASGLWYHAYWVKSRQAYPKKNLYWGRGNGWVLFALPSILDYLGDFPEKEEIIEVFQKTAAAVCKTQNENGMFKTLLLQPSYEETSGTALIAAGLINGVNHGYLDKKFLEPGIKAFAAVASKIQSKNGRIILPGISGPTIPLPVFPKLGYKLIPRGDNWSYGIAALIFAALAYAQIGKEKRIPWLINGGVISE